MNKCYIFLSHLNTNRFVKAFSQTLKCTTFHAVPITDTIANASRALARVRENATIENTSSKSIMNTIQTLSKLDEELKKRPSYKSVFDYSWSEWSGVIPQDTFVAFAGILRGTEEIFKSCTAQGREWYYFDHAYFFSYGCYNDSIAGDKWFRICKNNVHKTHIDRSTAVDQRYNNLIARLDKNLIEQLIPKPWRYTGSHILVIPPTYHTARWYGIDRKQWTSSIVNKIRQHDQKRRIVVREKFKDGADWGDRVDKPLNDDLVDCYAMVSFHSTAAVKALMAGIPCFTSEHSPAFPVSLGLSELHKIGSPLYSNEREDWIKSLLFSQFTLDEMRDGTAFSYLNFDKKCRPSIKRIYCVEFLKCIKYRLSLGPKYCVEFLKCIERRLRLFRNNITSYKSS
jgi:hypothetical protein